MERTPLQQELEAAGPMAQTDKKQRAINACALLTFCFRMVLDPGAVYNPRPGPSTILVTLLGLYLYSSLQSLAPNQTILYHVIKTTAREGFGCSYNKEMTRAWDDEALALISWVDHHIVGYIMEID